MKKILFLIISICLAITLAGCSKKKISYKFYNVVDKNDSIFSSTKEISTMKLKGVPKSSIEIGYFAYAGIYFEVTYIDGERQRIDLNEGFFPESDLIEFKTPGDKYFDLVYKGTHYALRFKLVEPTQPIKYLVNFHDRSGNVIYKTYCSYLDEAKCLNESAITNYTDGKGLYVFNGKWDRNLSHIYSNLDVYPIYDKCFYGNVSDNYYSSSDNYKVADVNSSGDTYHLLMYMGRIDNVVLASLDTIQLTEQKNLTFEFDKKKEYGTSDKLNAAILENIKSLISDYYIHDNWTPVWSDYYVLTNSSKLNFDLNNVDENNVPKCFTTSFSNYSGFSGFTREDGAKVSDKNVLDKTSPELFLTEYIGTGEGASKATFDITPDYKLGYYRADFVCDLDIFVDFTYTKQYVYQYTNEYILTEVKIGFSYATGESRFVLRYSPDGNFDDSGIPFTIQDRRVVATMGTQQ